MKGRVALARKIVTVGWDASAVRLLEVNGNRVEKWVSAFLEPGVVKNGVVLKPKVLGASVNELMRSSGITVKKVAAATSGLYSIMRMVGVPRLSEEATALAVRQAARVEMPVPIEDLYLSWHPIGFAGNERQVLILGSPRNVVDSGVQALRLAGLNPYIMDMKAAALARAVGEAEALILNIEPSGLEIVVVKNGILQLIHAVTQNARLSVDERAEEIDKVLATAIDFYNSRHPENPINTDTALFLAGQGATEPALVERLQATVGYPVKSFAIPLKYPADFPVAEYAVNAGIAVRSAEKTFKPGDFSVPDVNLLPATFSAGVRLAKHGALILGIVLAIAVAFLFYQSVMGAVGKTTELRERIEYLNQRIKVRQVDVTKLNQMMVTIQEYTTITGKRGSFMKDLDIIETEAKKFGIDVRSVSLETDKVVIAAQAESYAYFDEYIWAFDNFRLALLQTGAFSSARNTPLNFPPVDNIILTLERKR